MPWQCGMKRSAAGTLDARPTWLVGGLLGKPVVGSWVVSLLYGAAVLGLKFWMHTW